MFERFTDRAQRVIVLAQEESRLLSHDYIGTAHLLLGLIHEDEGVAARALRSQDVSLPALREQAENLLGRGTHDLRGHIPFSINAKAALERALREALKMNHNYIGTEHLLLGLISQGGTGADMLGTMQVDVDQLRLEVVRLLDGGSAPAKKQLIIDCTALGLSDQLDKVHGWRTELGVDHPDYQLGLARFLEMAARRLRASAKSV